MTVPLWALLGFALWTLLILFTTVGWYRWSRILTGREAIASFRADQVQGSPAYQRAMRAHANCVENLPVFAALVIVAALSQAGGPAFDALALTVLAARIAHSVVHVAFEQTNAITSLRFALFFTQIVAMIWLAVLIARHALG